MQFTIPRRRRAAERIVPMINVVFLLLIFFLMTARLAPPDPFEVTPPDAAGALAEMPAGVLHVAADGRLAFGPARGEAVFAAIAAWPDKGAGLTLRADGAAPAVEIARILERVAAAGVSEVRIVTTGPARP